VCCTFPSPNWIAKLVDAHFLVFCQELVASNAALPTRVFIDPRECNDGLDGTAVQFIHVFGRSFFRRFTPTTTHSLSFT
jgi:hypothetical protein